MRTALNTVAAVAAMSAVSSCKGERVEIVLEPQGGCESECGRASLGCVDHLMVYQGPEPTTLSGSRPVEHTTENHNLCEHGLADAVTVDIRAETSYVEVWGTGPAHPMAGADRPPVFIARGEYRENQDVLALEARCALACESLHPWGSEKWVVDLVTDVVPSEVEAVGVEVGMAYDMRAFYPEQPEPEVRFAPFPVGAEGPRVSDGRVVLTGDAYEWPFEAGGRCFAARLRSDAAGNQVICVEPEEPVLRLVDGARSASVREWLELHDVDRPPELGFFVGVVRAADTGLPLIDAAAFAPEEAAVLYPGFGEIWSADAPAAERTAGQGVFIVRGPFVGDVEVARDGYHPAVVRVGAVPAQPGARVIQLAPVE